MPPPRLRLARPLTQRIRSGHPWVYREALLGGVPRSGTVVDLWDERGFVARGFSDDSSPIAVRVLGLLPDEPIDERWAFARARRACEVRRAAAWRIDSDAVRLIHGEGDFMPGLVLDAYGDSGVVRFDGQAAQAFWRPRVPAVVRAAGEAGYPLARVWARPVGRGGGGVALLGDEPAGVVIREGAARYEVDLVHGQKTGFFLDQRENRLLVGRLAAGLDVLNLFAYTGGFSVAAALGGARRVTSVDQARPAIEAATRNMALNGASSHEEIAEDAFAFLARARAEGRRWDLVVCDPPSFAPSAKARPAARQAYRDLNRACAAVVASDGVLGTASCSSHVTPAEFQADVAAGVTQAGRPARLLDVRGAGPDHPVPAGFPEGAYLKFLLLHLE